jgi:hypothetical protein
MMNKELKKYLEESDHGLIEQFCLEGLRNLTKKPNQDSPCYNRDSNRGFPTVSKVKDILTITNQSGFSPTISSVDASIIFILNSSNSKIDVRTNEDSLPPDFAFFLCNLCTENVNTDATDRVERNTKTVSRVEFNVVFVTMSGNTVC